MTAPAQPDRAAAIAEQLERCFADIQATRMDGVPILNPSLMTACVGMQSWRSHHLCILLTPWFMNVMLLPEEQDKAAGRVGDKQEFEFPAGVFEFIRGHEDAIGAYWMCSLFSPMFEFQDQQTALAAAEASIAELMRPAEPPAEHDAKMAMIWRGELPEEPEAAPAAEEEAAPAEDGAPTAPSTVSRRAFLRGGARESEAS
ncbi:MAG: [NiFe]-hydrogenase assembly chaperone HybE [Neomegalonema sp.]|nr:[NiFe]-hydrogenase assembly chaperone HybE [Neomegalonema sp.]